MTQAEAIKLLRDELQSMVKFAEHHMQFCQPSFDSGEEPADAYTHHACSVCTSANQALAATEQVDNPKPVETDGVKSAEEWDKEWSRIFSETCRKTSMAEAQKDLNAKFLELIHAIQQNAIASVKVDDGMMLPELLEGWEFESLSSAKGNYACTIGFYPPLPVKPKGNYSIQDVINSHISIEGAGQSPRAAVLVAIAKIGEGK